MSAEEEKLVYARQQMVGTQLKARGIRCEAILHAFAEVPRERFLPPERMHEAYQDRAVPIGCAQTISQPYVVALMLEELDLHPDHRVLDVGAGSGYQTALLARLVREVYSIERLGELTERARGVLSGLGITNVILRTGDGSLGWGEGLTFDRIICGAGAPRVPDAWLEELNDGGRIVAPLGPTDSQTVIVVEKDGQNIRRRAVCDVRFVKLIGAQAWDEQ